MTQQEDCFALPLDFTRDEALSIVEWASLAMTFVFHILKKWLVKINTIAKKPLSRLVNSFVGIQAELVIICE